MGHRKKHAPRRGSLACLPRARASRWIGRVRFWPSPVEGARPLAFVGYKAGMGHAVAVDQRQGSLTFGKEIAVPVTILETPPMVACALRAYVSSETGLRTLTECWIEKPPKDLGRLVTIPEKFNTEEAMKKIESSLDQIQEVRLLLATQPRLAKIGRKKPELIEVKIAGRNAREQFEYARGVLGKEIRASDAFKEGEWVDAIAVTKGKGIQGPVKRWGVRILSHKSRKTRRGVGSIGPWHPHYVVYSVPRAGQTGFHQRTEYNKQIIKIGEEGGEVTPKSGFVRYGIVNGQYVILRGSVPGPARRSITLRHAVRSTGLPRTAPKIEHLSLRPVPGD